MVLSSSMFELFLFGSPRIERAGQHLHLPRRKALGLLAYLALSKRESSKEGRQHCCGRTGTTAMPAAAGGQGKTELRQYDLCRNFLQEELGVEPEEADFVKSPLVAVYSFCNRLQAATRLMEAVHPDCIYMARRTDIC